MFMAIIHMKIFMRQTIFLSLLVFGLFFVMAKPAAASERLIAVYLDAETINRGYTVATPNEIFRLGVFPGVVNQATHVILKSFNQTEIELPQNLNLVSPIYEYDMRGQENPLLLHQPLAITLSYDSDNYRPKNVYYWNAVSNIWQPLPSKTIWAGDYVQAISHLPYSKVAVFEEPLPSHERKSFDFLADDAALGQTVGFEDGTIYVEMTENSVDSRTLVTLKDVDTLPGEIPAGHRLVSQVFAFHIYTERQPILLRPINVNISYYSPNLNAKCLKYWDGNKQEWVSLPSAVDYDNWRVRGAIHLSYAIVAVFESDEFQAQEGIASWYYISEHPYGAANNDFDFDTRLLVTNLENNRTVIVTVVDRGPFVPGRIIDLSKKAFGDLANTSQGVIRVRVEKINTN